MNKDNYRERVNRLEVKFGPMIKVRRGGGLTAMLPTDGIPDHLKDKAVVVKT